MNISITGANMFFRIFAYIALLFAGVLDSNALVIYSTKTDSVLTDEQLFLYSDGYFYWRKYAPGSYWSEGNYKIYGDTIVLNSTVRDNISDTNVDAKQYDINYESIFKVMKETASGAPKLYVNSLEPSPMMVQVYWRMYSGEVDSVVCYKSTKIPSGAVSVQIRNLFTRHLWPEVEITPGGNSDYKIYMSISSRPFRKLVDAKWYIDATAVRSTEISGTPSTSYMQKVYTDSLSDKIFICSQPIANGFSKNETITLMSDGQFEYESRFEHFHKTASGFWTQNGDIITIKIDSTEELPIPKKFILQDDVLISVEDKSTDKKYRLKPKNAIH